MHGIALVHQCDNIRILLREIEC